MSTAMRKVLQSGGGGVPYLALKLTYGQNGHKANVGRVAAQQSQRTQTALAEFPPTDPDGLYEA